MGAVTSVCPGPKTRNVWARVSWKYDGAGVVQGAVQGPVTNFWARASSKYDRCRSGCCRELLGQGVARLGVVQVRVIQENQTKIIDGPKGTE